MRPFTLHAAAETELAQALEYYDRQRPGLAAEFRVEFEAALGRIAQDPRMYAAEDDSGVRQCPRRRFPYTLHDLELDDGIWIAAVAHQRKRPGYWARRRPG